MDTIAQLALLAKAKLVFESPSNFLSFPVLSPLAYKPDNLNFANALLNAEIGRTLSEFSRLVNSLPEGTVFQGEGDSYLWQVYNQWLTDMMLAQDRMTPDEKAQYEQANALLTVIDANGFATDSPVVFTYKQYRDIWFNADQNYKAQQLTATTSSDVAVQTQWKNVDEPRLRALVAQAAADWENKGNKAAVEQAQAVKTQFDARSPSSAWNEWRGAFDPRLDMLTDAVSNMEYAPTGFSPSDIFAQDWPTFRISGAEIAQLAQSAPKELRDIFTESNSTSMVTSLSFEFRSVTLVRSWLRSAVFGAHFWKFRDGIPPVSDGATPPRGSWPCYPIAVVFARNIQVTTQAAPQQPQPVSTLPPVAVNPVLLRRQLLREPLRLEERSPTVATRLATVRPTIMARPVMGVAQVAAPVMSRPVLLSPVLRLSATTYRALPIATPSGTPSTPPAPQPAPGAPNNNISILAFICRRLPKTPDPEPSLKW